MTTRRSALLYDLFNANRLLSVPHSFQRIHFLHRVANADVDRTMAKYTTTKGPQRTRALAAGCERSRRGCTLSDPMTRCPICSALGGGGMLTIYCNKESARGAVKQYKDNDSSLSLDPVPSSQPSNTRTILLTKRLFCCRSRPTRFQEALRQAGAPTRKERSGRKGERGGGTPFIAV